MTSTKENFHETSETTSQAVISAQELGLLFTACDTWKSDVNRLTKEGAEQSTWRRAGNNSTHCPSVLQPPPGMGCSQHFTPTERLDSPKQTSRPGEGTPWEHIPSTSDVLSDTRSVAAESTSKRTEAEKFELSLGTSLLAANQVILD